MGIALQDVRVLDFTVGVAGPLATMFLGDFGADVIKVEPPLGDPARRDPGFAVWNRNKRAASFDATDTTSIARLIGEADVVVTASSRSKLLEVGLAPEDLLERHPRLVYLHVPPYLDEAPWAGGRESSPLLEAISGLALRQYSFDGGPVESVSPFLLYEQGIWAAASVAAALVERQHSGRGQLVTVGGMHAAVIGGIAGFVLDPSAAPQPPAGPGGRNPLYSMYRCSDGKWLFLASLTMRFKERALDILGLADVANDPRLAGDLDNTLLLENRGWVRDAISKAVADRSLEEWLETLESGGAAVGPLGEREAWLDHPQISAIGMRAVVEDPERGTVVMPGVPIVLERSPGSIRLPAPPRSDPDGAGVTVWEPTEPLVLGGEPRRTEGPLSGVRILDLGTILAGPFVGSLLCELGADVVKVEPPEGDPFRRFGAIFNRGMRSVSIDLRDPDGRAAMLALVKGADVVIDNYRHGILERFGLRYEDLRAVRPDIISLTVMAFGEEGPLASKLGFDPVLQGLSGMMGAQGGSDEPVYLVAPVNDAATAPMVALQTCLALLHRSRTGEGQRGWVSLAGVSAFLQSGEIVSFPGRSAPVVGGRDFPGPGALTRYYAASDGWIRLEAAPAALRVIGTLVGDRSIATASPDAVEGLLADAFAKHTRDDLVATFTEARIPVAPARTRDDLIADASLQEAGVLDRRDRVGRVPWVLPDHVVRFSETERRVPLDPPGIGEHSVDLLVEAGLTEAEVASLIDRGVVVAGPPEDFSFAVNYK